MGRILVLPIPNQFGSLWVNFNFLLWDVCHIAYSCHWFWYIGLILILQQLEIELKTLIKEDVFNTIVWMVRKSKHWNRFELVSLVLAGLATPLVFSVHSIVSRLCLHLSFLDGTRNIPSIFRCGSGIFRLYNGVNFIVDHAAMSLEAYIHTKHVEYMNIVIMVTGSIVGTAYITELFISWYSGVE